MEETPNDCKEPIAIVPLLLVQWIIGGGIAFIGSRMKNDLEFKIGILVVFAILALVVAGIYQQCDSLCGTLGPFNPFRSDCSGCFLKEIMLGTVGLLALASWAYTIARCYLINQKKENSFKLL